MGHDHSFAELVQRLKDAADDNGRAQLIRRFADDDVLEAMLDAIFAEIRRDTVSFDDLVAAEGDLEAIMDTSTVYLHGWCQMAWDYDGIEWFDDKGHFSWWGIGMGLEWHIE